MLEDEKLTTPGELKLSDMPPVEKLDITVPVENLIKVGKVESIVGVLVVVDTVRSMPPLDLDSILFKADGEPIGKIFDVFGNVKEPHYSIRFTDEDQIKDKQIYKDMPVYFVPLTDRTITKFAFVEELRKIKGTDASWEGDNEAPDNMQEFSDDEEQLGRQRA